MCFLNLLLVLLVSGFVYMTRAENACDLTGEGDCNTKNGNSWNKYNDKDDNENGNYDEQNELNFDSADDDLVCSISIPTDDDRTKCKIQRKNDISLNRQFYILTGEGEERDTPFPIESFPFLNQPMDAIKYHTALDPVDSRWLTLMGTFKLRFEKQLESQRKKQMPAFDNITHYKAVYYQHNKEIKMMNAQKYLSNPAMEKTFTDVVGNDRWTTDDIFTQMRLAGACPFLIKLVTIDGTVGMRWDTLKKQLNSTYDFDSAIDRALGTTGFHLNEVVQLGMLYVLYNEDYNDMETPPDFFHKNHPELPSLENVTSPITLFVRTLSGELKVVAIQWDYKPESPVFSPTSDPITWAMAKTMVNLADTSYCQAVWHLSHVHFSSSVYCTVFRSHFSELHPIYQIMRYHCEGTTPHIALAWPRLAAPNMPGEQLFSMGHTGFIKLAVIGNQKYNYGLLAYDQLMEAHGLNSMNLTYHPFRDDGKVIWNEFQWFAKQFVNMFYTSNENVINDVELQSYANEISIDGKISPYGGRGKITGFPSSFETKEQLEVFLTRFLWLIAMHAAANYPIEPYTTFIPMTPMKLYHDEDIYKKGNMAYAYSDAPSTIGGLSFASLLGNFRLNRIMDHYDKIGHEELRKLIQYHHRHLHSNVQNKLEKRNAERKLNQQLGFQYFEPKWLTNSLHI